MKYKLKTIEKEVRFKPVKLTLTFETQKELTHFHKKVMRLLTPTQHHQFHGDIFNISQQEIDGAEVVI